MCNAFFFTILLHQGVGQTQSPDQGQKENNGYKHEYVSIDTLMNKAFYKCKC